MANPTTNYSWPMPTSADLVTDLPADFALFGQPVDTTLKALNPETTLGDIAFRSATSNTNTRLGIGSAGQVLSVSGGVPAWTTTADVTPLTTKGDLFTFSTVDARLGVGSNDQILVADSTASTGLKWATASAGALTKITSGSFSNVTTVDIDSVFSSTYKNYMVMLRTNAATDSNDLLLQYRVGSTTQTDAQYFGSLFGYNRSNVLINGGFASATSATLSIDAGASGGFETDMTLYFTNVGVSANSPTYWGTGMNKTSNQSAFTMAGILFQTATYTGFRLKSSSTNITGDYAVYGLAD